MTKLQADGREVQEVWNRWLTEVPVDWSVTRLRFTCDIATGSGDTQDADPDGAYSFFVRSPNPLQSTDFTFDTEAVLTAGDGAVGEVFHHVNGKFHAHQRVYVLSNFRDVLPRYFFYYFSSFFRLMAQDGSARTTVDSVRRWMLTDMPIPLPPLDEQCAIVDFLDQETAQIDALVAKQEEFIGLLRERRRMAIDRTLSSADDDSPRLRLKYMLLRVDQGVSPQAENGLVEGDEWGVLKTGCVNGGTFREGEHKRLPGDFPVDRKLAVHAGDLIVSRANGTPSYVGSAALVEQIDLNLILSDKLFRLVPRSDVDTQFLAWSMNSRAYRTQVEASISGAAGLANNLPLSDLRSFEFSRPELSAQKRIVENINEQVNAIDTLIAKAEEHISLAKERRSALITAAVTGQFDVRTARKAG